jgi:hypothetical protein
MMVMLTGCERTLAEYCELLKDAYAFKLKMRQSSSTGRFSNTPLSIVAE